MVISGRLPTGVRELFEALPLYLPEARVEEIRRAYDFAEECHRGQKRRSGEPYITHPVAVAALVASLRMDPHTVSAALLHDVVEDCDVTVEDLRKRFNPDIARLVRKPMEEIFPQLKGTKITHAWGGTLGITMNRMPHFERLTGNVLTASGYSGHGVALATLGGKLAAEAIAGQAERFDLMARIPTRPFPGGVALRWPLLVLAMAWFSLRDRL